MKTTNLCYSCLKRLISQAAALATTDVSLQLKAIKEAENLLDNIFSLDVVSIEIAAELHRVIKRVTSNPDPYKKMKEEELKVAQRLYQDVFISQKGNFKEYLMLSLLGNAMDFFREMSAIQEDLLKPVTLKIDDTQKLSDRVLGARKVLFLADNAGEIYFDFPLIKHIEQHTSVVYVVKEKPVQDDMTMSEVESSGLRDSLPRVITTGTDTPGVDFKIASEEFKAEFSSADLVLAKGMGYWESLSEMDGDGRICYFLKAKCIPVAASLSVAVGDNIVLVR